MQEVEGFELVWSRYIPEIQSQASLFRYQKNNAQVLSLENSDENKVFGITFRTPPKDSTGVAHILEHSVLCGSRKYPVKEPFIELLKGSLQTFLNALTFPDKTCYPVASQNLQDFYNLVDVYLDSVFFPRLEPEIFAQEGWHFAVQEEDSQQLSLQGVVYNEMKGAYSSPDGLLNEYSQQSLFPDSPYGLDSGGDPEQIPNLSYQDFLEFHRKYYHPANARIFFYGDDPPEKRLQMLIPYLEQFPAQEVDSFVPLQPRLQQPKALEKVYAADQDSQSKSMLTLNWLLDVGSNVQLNLAWQILDYILLGMPASPLRKALLDSGLGEDLAGPGLESDLRQMFISVGMKGVREDNLPQVEKLILDTLQELAEQGFDPETVRAAVNSVEFALRENNTGSMPRGLIVMLRSLATWLYDGDPTLLLKFEEPLEQLKQDLQAGERVFENLVQKFLLENSHYSKVILRPDPELSTRMQQKEQELLKEKQLRLSPKELQEIAAWSKQVRQKQEAPDRPEDLAKIPRLGRQDLPREEKWIPVQILQREPAPLLFHDLPTNNIFYLDLGLDLGQLEQKYLGYVPLWGRALLEMDTQLRDYVRLSQLIQAETGGIHTESFTSCLYNSSGIAAWMFFRGKSLPEQASSLLSILEEILTRPDFSDQDRFRQLVLEERSKMEQRLVPGGHQMVNSRLRAKYNLADWAQEHMDGLSYLLFLRYLEQELENNWDGVRSSLEAVHQTMVNSRSMVFNLTLDADNWSKLQPEVEGFMNRLPSFQPSPATWRVDCELESEGLGIPAQVNYVGKSLDLYGQGYSFHGSSLVANRYLRASWLWDKIRVQGGAYGAFSMLDRLSGILTLVSYRDPHILQTLQAFDSCAEFLAGSDFTQEEIDKAVVGAIGELDRYRLPDAKGMISLLRYLIGESREERQKLREEILATERQHFQDLGRSLQPLRDSGLIAVLGDKNKLEQAKEKGLSLEHIWQVL
ncbi:MAG: insulinase family protein [Thermodesulfobacteriota bacterium]